MGRLFAVLDWRERERRDDRGDGMIEEGLEEEGLEEEERGMRG